MICNSQFKVIVEVRRVSSLGVSGKRSLASGRHSGREEMEFYVRL